MKPISDKKRKVLKEIIGNNRQKWVNDTVTGTDSYPDGFSIFNEFMTWSLFSMYAYDNYSEEEVDKYLKSMDKNMDLRGFLHFDEFNAALITKYNENKNISIPDLINYMIEWCSKK